VPTSAVLGGMDATRRDRCQSAILFALPWPLPTYAFVGSLLVVINERLLETHFFDASGIASAAALAALLGAAAWADRHDGRDHEWDPR
jgi:hypothetical protein